MAASGMRATRPRPVVEGPSVASWATTKRWSAEARMSISRLAPRRQPRARLDRLNGASAQRVRSLCHLSLIGPCGPSTETGTMAGVTAEGGAGRSIMPADAPARRPSGFRSPRRTPASRPARSRSSRPRPPHAPPRSRARGPAHVRHRSPRRRGSRVPWARSGRCGRGAPPPQTVDAPAAARW